MTNFRILVFLLYASVGLLRLNCAAEEVSLPRQLRLPLTMARGGRIFITIIVDQHPSVMLIDTGAPVSFLHGPVSQECKDNPSNLVRGISGMTSATSMRKAELDFGQTISATVSVRILDLSALRLSTTKNDGWPLIDGAIGSDVLSAFAATIDYERSMLILNVPSG